MILLMIENLSFGNKNIFEQKLSSRIYFWSDNFERFLVKIDFSLQLANLLVSYTYFGARFLHFKPKYD